MANLPHIEFEELKHVFLKPYIDSLRKEIHKGKTLLSNTEEAFQSYYGRLSRIDSKNELSKCINETNWLKSTLFQILDKELPERREVPYSEEFEAFLISAQKFLANQELQIEVEQKEARFKIIENDSARVKLIKPWKKLFYKISIIPQKLAHLFSKEKNSIPFWTHRVPFRVICSKHFEINFALNGLHYFEELQKQKCATLNLIIEINHEIDLAFQDYLEAENPSKEKYIEKISALSEQVKIEELKKTLEEQLAAWEIESEAALKKEYDNFLYTIERAGTVEIDAAQFSASVIKEENNNLISKYNRIFQGWRNTFFAQIDDLQVDLELYLIKYCSLQQLELLQKSCQSRIQKAINEKIGVIEKEYQGFSQKIKENKSIEDLARFLKSEKKRIGDKLEKEIIPEAIESVYNQNIPELLSRLELKIKEQINKMKEKRIIYSHSQYNAPISKNDLSHFNPKELVEIDIFSKFSKRNAELKSKVVQALELIQLNLNDLVGISDYNLDSAISSLEDGKALDEVISISITGIQRATEKSKEVSQQLEEIELLIDQTLEEGIREFNKSIISLTENDNITQIRLKITKAKTLEKTEEYRRQLIQNIKGFLPIALRYLRQKSQSLLQYSELLLKRAGLSEKDQKLTAELTDFLTQTDQAIEKLPYVYKRLYQIKALEDELFFEGRRIELDQLQKAYDSWQSGNVSATCLHGEKGSGASSLVNLFLKQNKDGAKLYRSKLNKSYSTEADFIHFFQNLLGDKELKSYDDILKKLLSGKKKIIVLEDFQHFYLKKIEGFIALRHLLELVSESGDQVFWLFEITSYTYRYLQKTVSIELYFRYPIELKKLNNQQIINLILKRHRVSGYKLKFDASGLQANERKKLRGMSEKNQEEFLKEKFFNTLNQFAQSNISLALLYWLRSTKSVNDNTIVMSQIQHLDFNFLKKLDNDSIFTLHALLLHDSLSPEEHAAVFHQSVILSRRILMILEDRGLLSSKENRFYLNRLLYRQVVNTLLNKNIIH